MSDSSGDNGFAVICLFGVVIYAVCKLKQWFPDKKARDEKLPLFYYDLTDFTTPPIINEGLVDHTFPIPTPTPPPIAVYNLFMDKSRSADDLLNATFGIRKRPNSPHMLTFQEMIEGNSIGSRVGSGDFLDRLSVGTDHEVAPLDWLLKENNIYKEVPRSPTPCSEVSVESEVVSRGSGDSWDVISV